MIKPNKTFATGAHILVVDDHEDSRVVAQMVLEHAGYSVTSAETGTEGFNLAIQELPDIVLTDIVLPEMDGLEMTRRLRLHPLTSDLRIIAVTALARTAIREETLLAGCDAYLSKPYHVAALRALVFEQLLLARHYARSRIVPI